MTENINEREFRGDQYMTCDGSGAPQQQGGRLEDICSLYTGFRINLVEELEWKITKISHRSCSDSCSIKYCSVLLLLTFHFIFN
ncbi:hypothetical protein GDO81_000017 [Engystomops pustulosus]|uniref:Uncharacterized protein n=1 Tax=Engystomops pustulosus TaxID=76066 RepID=A0AAV7D2W2_ENGPU|nr:hypothetical protein GDO81_000017 [Engystomops pustulosus]